MKPVEQTKLHVPGKQNGNCMAAAIASLLELPLSDVPNFEDMGMTTPKSDRWFESLKDWLFELGFELLIWDQPVVLKGYYLVGGKSDRGFEHQVVYKNGKMIHDPHPDKTGILTFTDQWALLPLNPALCEAEVEPNP